jgi:hypothetical protein
MSSPKETRAKAKRKVSQSTCNIMGQQEEGGEEESCQTITAHVIDKKTKANVDEIRENMQKERWTKHAQPAWRYWRD